MPVQIMNLLTLDNIIMVVVALILCCVVLKFIKGVFKTILLIAIGAFCVWYMSSNGGVGVLTNIFNQLKNIL